MTKGPLNGIIVVDLSQFLAGPYASLRLQDLGARVIKIERPGLGDLCRQLYLSDTVIDGESTIFHAINRGKESLELDLKDGKDLAALKKLISKADVVIQNFRPGVIERLGLDYASVSTFAPHIVYCSISGYGTEGPWLPFPGQDLLAQARSGLMWLNGSAGDGPVPFGLAVADMMAGANAAQAILAGLVKQGREGTGLFVQTSLLESLLDLQFEMLATYLNDGGRPPKRAETNSAHAGLAAPYGVYATRDGWLAIAMTPITQLAPLLEAPGLYEYADKPDTWFSQRDAIKQTIAARVRQEPTQFWLDRLLPHDIWCAKIMDWDELFSHPAFETLNMVQVVKTRLGRSLRLMRSPIKWAGERGGSVHAAPDVGEHSGAIRSEFGL